MKRLRIRLSKAIIDNKIDNRTYKRMEASLQNLSEVSKDAVASDTEEDHDASLITSYRDKRDAKIRMRLIRWIKEEIPAEEFTNRPKTPNPDYTYTFEMPDDFRTEMMGAIKDLLEDYIVRGATYDWYLNAGLAPTDSEASLEALENEILVGLRGKPSTTRPLQPFGPPFPVTPLF